MELLSSNYLLDDGRIDSETSFSPVQLAANGSTADPVEPLVTTATEDNVWAGSADRHIILIPVSYTHLTLPTTPYV